MIFPINSSQTLSHQALKPHNFLLHLLANMHLLDICICLFNLISIKNLALHIIIHLALLLPLLNPHPLHINPLPPHPLPINRINPW